LLGHEITIKDKFSRVVTHDTLIMCH
jgi:hypothetical protein